MKATDRQIKYFFSLVRQLGHDQTKSKELAKERFDLEHFDDISSEQISQLIQKMLLTADKKGVRLEKEQDIKPFVPAHAKKWDEQPDKGKSTDDFTEKDWRQVDHIFSEACEHDWKVVESEHDVFTVKKCLNCPSVIIENYGKKNYELYLKFRVGEVSTHDAATVSNGSDRDDIEAAKEYDEQASDSVSNGVGEDSNIRTLDQVVDPTNW